MKEVTSHEKKICYRIRSEQRRTEIQHNMPGAKMQIPYGIVQALCIIKGGDYTVTEFEICYTEHELKYVRVEAKSKKDAKQKFKDGNIDWDSARGYGDYGDPTLNSVEVAP